MAGDGDDVVHDAEQELNGDAVRGFDLGAGNDTFFGGRDGLTVSVDGGDGNDKIFGPDDVNDGSDSYGNVNLDGGAGDDIIDHGDWGHGEYGYGGDGNDKLIGGLATNVMLLDGGPGDDKIWMINPEQRGLEPTPDDSWTGIGGPGNDHMFGSNIGEFLIGDDGELEAGSDDAADYQLDYGAPPHADYYNEAGGDDVIRGYGGADFIFGMAGNDALFGGTGDDEVIGGRGDDKLFGEDGDDLMYGDEKTSDSHDQDLFGTDDSDG